MKPAIATRSGHAGWPAPSGRQEKPRMGRLARTCVRQKNSQEYRTRFVLFSPRVSHFLAPNQGDAATYGSGPDHALDHRDLLYGAADYRR